MEIKIVKIEIYRKYFEFILYYNDGTHKIKKLRKMFVEMDEKTVWKKFINEYPKVNTNKIEVIN